MIPESSSDNAHKALSLTLVLVNSPLVPSILNEIDVFAQQIAACGEKHAAQIKIGVNKILELAHAFFSRV